MFPFPGAACRILLQADIIRSGSVGIHGQQPVSPDGLAQVVHPAIFRHGNPQQMRNEVWFYAGLDRDILRIVPEQGTPLDGHGNAMQTSYVPLDTLPARVKLDNGSALTLTDVSVAKDGFLGEYLPEGHTGYLGFGPADAQNQRLNLNFISFDQLAPVKKRLVAGGYWSREYKDRIISAVTQEDLEQVKTLAIDYRLGESRLPEDMAVEVKPR